MKIAVQHTSGKLADTYQSMLSFFGQIWLYHTIVWTSDNWKLRDVNLDKTRVDCICMHVYTQLAISKTRVDSICMYVRTFVRTDKQSAHIKRSCWWLLSTNVEPKLACVSPATSNLCSTSSP